MKNGRDYINSFRIKKLEIFKAIGENKKKTS